MDIKDIGSIRFEALRTDEAKELGINVLFQEEDGTYDWIYCLSMAKNLSMFKFVTKIVILIFVPIAAMLLFLSWGSGNFLMMMGILALCLGGVMLIILFAFWLVNKLFKGSYMLVYQMNNDEIMFSQTADQAEITRTIAAASAIVNTVGKNVGGAIAGTGLAMRPNIYTAKFAKVSSVKGDRKDNLIWVNTFLQSLMIYVPDEFYDFVWNYITQRCDKARISER